MMLKGWGSRNLPAGSTSQLYHLGLVNTAEPQFPDL